jgi:hypothetical protein
MPKPSSRSNPDAPPRTVDRRPRSWPKVQLPATRGSVPYEQAAAAVRAVRDRRLQDHPA